jgi:prepilin-type N-terminal cleavage/methylation domain-containing protein
MPRRASRRLCRGFTLIEMMFALVILAGGLLAMLMVQTQALKQGRYGRHTTDAMQVARDQMEYFMRLPWGDAAVQPTGWTAPAPIGLAVQNEAGAQTQQTFDVSWRITRACRTSRDRGQRDLDRGRRGCRLPTQLPARQQEQLELSHETKHARLNLIELVVSITFHGLVSFFLTELLVRSSRTYTVVDDVTAAQQNLRAVTTLLERELRSTGFLVPEGAAICGWDTGGAGAPDTDPDVLYVSDADALDPAGVTSLTSQAADVDEATFSGTGVDDLKLSSLVVDANPFYDLDDDGVADSDFLWTTTPARNGGVIVVDRNNPERGAACGVITSIDVGANTVRVDFEVKNAPNSPTPNGAASGGTPLLAGGVDLVAVPAHVYWVNPGAAGQPPQLIRDGMVLANDVEDLQLAMFYDVDDDGVVDALEYPGSAGAEYESDSWNNQDLREVRVTVVARTRTQDPDVLANPNLASGVTQGFENRAAGVATDGFRRRSITLTVQPRNVDRVL